MSLQSPHHVWRQSMTEVGFNSPSSPWHPAPICAVPMGIHPAGPRGGNHDSSPLIEPCVWRGEGWATVVRCQRWIRAGVIYQRPHPPRPHRPHLNPTDVHHPSCEGRSSTHPFTTAHKGRGLGSLRLNLMVGGGVRGRRSSSTSCPVWPPPPGGVLLSVCDCYVRAGNIGVVALSVPLYPNPFNPPPLHTQPCPLHTNPGC